jgi:hypothetical protein
MCCDDDLIFPAVDVEQDEWQRLRDWLPPLETCNGDMATPDAAATQMSQAATHPAYAAGSSDGIFENSQKFFEHSSSQLTSHPPGEGCKRDVTVGGWGGQVLSEVEGLGGGRGVTVEEGASLESLVRELDALNKLGKFGVTGLVQTAEESSSLEMTAERYVSRSLLTCTESLLTCALSQKSQVVLRRPQKGQ